MADRTAEKSRIDKRNNSLIDFAKKQRLNSRFVENVKT